MKSLIIVLLAVLASYPVMAQDETLLSGEVESGGYGGPICKIGRINGEAGIFVGGQGGWIINHRFVLGGKGYGLVNDVDIEGSRNLRLDFGCGGAFLEYIISPHELLHLSLHSMIGAGGVVYSVRKYTDDQAPVNYNGDAFFVVEPGINCILNVTNYFRIGAGVTYRYVDGVKYESLSDSDLSGASAEVLLKFGVF
jgi:hypothetical protein